MIDRHTSGTHVATVLGFISLILTLTNTTLALAQSWSRVQGLPFEQFSSLVDIEGVVYAGGERTVYRSVDRGTTWMSLGIVHPDILALGPVTRFDGNLWVGTYKAGVWRSTDDGAHWIDASDGISGLGSDDILCFSVRGDSLYAGTGGAGVFVRGTGESVWTPFSEGLSSNTSYTIYTLATVDGALTATAGGNGGVFRRPLGSTVWLEALLPGAPIPGLELVDMYRLGDLLFVAGSRFVYKSSDGGQTWTECPTPFPEAQDARLASIGNRLYAIVNSVHQGAITYVSDDRGENWRQDETIGFSYVADMLPVDGKLFAACEDGLRAFNPIPSSATDAPAPAASVMHVSAPHPIRDAAKLSFTLAAHAAAELMVIDAYGRTHVVMPARLLPAGRHTWTWDAGTLSAGAYMFILRAGNERVTRPFIITR